MSLDTKRHPFYLFLLLVVVVLLFMFRGVLAPNSVLFSNDGPLGAQNMQAVSLPSGFKAVWYDLNAVGYNGGAFSPTLTNFTRWMLGPLQFSRFYVPLVILFLGSCAWLFFARLKLSPLACALGALATMFNSGFFSAAAWGVGPQPVCFGFDLLALAALTLQGRLWGWLKYVLAGFAVGIGVMEGADVGAIFSMLVAAYVFYQALVDEPLPGGKRLAKGVITTALVGVAAGFIAAQTLDVLISTQIKGVAGTEQDTQTKEQRWDWATQWSLPKSEALGLVVPGLFGYRMDTPDGGNYWGAVGRDPQWDRYFAKGKQGPQPGGFLRFTGGGIYAGVLVVLVGLWAVLRGLPKGGVVFTPAERKQLWFWTVVAVISLLLSFGRFAPFYWFLYQLPYFSTIRNPAKWIHVLNLALVILFAYGVNGLWRFYMEPASVAPGKPGAPSATWWNPAQVFDRRWALGSLVVLCVSIAGWLAYAQNREDLAKYLQGVGFGPDTAQDIARFSVGQAGWFVPFLALALLLVVLILSGRFAGKRAGIGAALLVAFVVVDFARANAPWIIVWDYKQKYASNPVIDKFREKPYEHRVALIPEWLQQATGAAEQGSLLNQLYRIEWHQHHFLYYDVQSLDIVQMSRMAADLKTFEETFQPRTMADIARLLPRRWELTNTRFLLGPAGYADFLNRQLDPQRQRFKVAESFQITGKPGIPQAARLEEVTAVPATNGGFTVIEFTGALPRVQLYSNWQVSTNGQATLSTLTNPAFNPAQTVIIDEPISLPTGATNQPAGSAGTVDFVSYAPKHVTLKADAKVQSVLLMNDHFDPSWKATVDGKPAKLFRANYLMRGLLLQPGPHQIEMTFEPPIGALYVSIVAMVIGVALCALLLINRREEAQKTRKN